MDDDDNHGSDDAPSQPGDATRELTAARPFYRSVPRQRLTFVPAGNAPSGAPAPARDVASIYEAIVLKHRAAPSTGPQSPADPSAPAPARAASEPAPDPRASLVHQVAAAHSHPPSHLDRSRTGYRYLAAYGWDADARVGLGPEGAGVRAPVKAVPKNNTAGLGLQLGKARAPEPARAQLLDAGKVRKQAARQRRQDARLRDLIYGDGKVARYLGEDAEP